MKLSPVVGIIFSRNVKMNELCRACIKFFNCMYSNLVDNVKYRVFDQMNLDVRKDKNETE